MKTQLLTLSLLGTLVLAGCGDKKPAAPAEEKKDTTATAAKPEETPAAPMDSAAMAKAWEEFATPGDMHKWMADNSGKWQGEIKMWMDPAAPPTVSKASAEFKMILGGRYQEGIHKSDFNGMPFEGRGTMAYDNTKKVFLTTWIDNMGTGIMTMEGKWDEATKTLTSEGKQTDPTTGKDMSIREVCKFPDANTQTMEMFCTGPDGKEMKTMEMTMTRK